MRGFLKRFLPILFLLLFLLAANAALAYTTLEKGSTGAEVIRMQQALATLGYTVGADGVFGTQTRNAVKAFQTDQKLKVDGKAGNQTLTVLYNLESQKKAAGTAYTAPPTVTAAPTAAAQQARVYCSDGGKLNLRAGAGSGYKAIDKIPTGDTVVVLAYGSKWCYVAHNGLNGYVMTSFLQFGNNNTVTAAPAVTAPSSAAGTRAIVSCADGGKLNLRKSPASGAKVLEKIPNGTALTVYAAGGKWYGTVYNGQAGYVQGGFLDFGATVATTAPAVTAAPAATAIPSNAIAAVVQCTGSLNLRETRSTNGRVMDRIPNGTRLTVFDAGDNWYAVSYNGLNGYVMGKFLNLGASGTAAPAVTAAPVTANSLQYEEFRYATVNAPSGTLNVRKGPGETYNRVSELRSGTQIVIRSIEGDWCAMYYGDIQGYVNKNYLSISGPNGTVQTSAVTGSGSYSTYVMDYNGNTSSAKTSAVRRAQQALRELNYNVPLTGAFEARTHDAIVAFQLRNGLTANGTLDSATQAALYSGKARDAASPSRFYLPESAGRGISTPANVQLLHWSNEVSGLLSGKKYVTAYDSGSGLSWTLSILSRGRHLDVEPASLTDTMIQKKAFGSTSWDVHPVYIQMPDGRWTLATMHDYPHGVNTIADNGFGGQNCVHFLRDMAEAQKNDPSYGVQNQEVLRSTWYKMTGITVTN